LIVSTHENHIVGNTGGGSSRGPDVPLQGGYPPHAVLKHRSDEGPAWYGDGLDRLDRARLEEALGELAIAVRLRPDYLKARLSVEKLLVRLGPCEESMRQLSEILSLEPNSVEGRSGLADCIPAESKPEE
jgi:hypothetical protein